MPELPEVENLRRGLEKNILGQKILSVEVRKPKLVSGKGNARKPRKDKARIFKKGLTGERFLAIERRAKNLIFKFWSGKIMLAHLKMSGQFVYKAKKGGSKIIGGHPIELSEKELPNKHSHVIFGLNNGTLYYNDTRMFGYLLYYRNAQEFEKESHFALLGLEPFDKEFTVKYFIKALKSKKSKIKVVLMDQKIVTGLGNIYADESLFEAGIHPEKKASSITKEKVNLLYNAIKRILKRAIKVGGSSVATYRLLDNTRGNYAREHKVYGKEGEKCTKPCCKGIIKRKVINGRSAHFCSIHQKL